jgi:hypothetical protein
MEGIFLFLEELIAWLKNQNRVITRFDADSGSSDRFHAVLIQTDARFMPWMILLVRRWIGSALKDD